jgi:hypothetical protein
MELYITFDESKTNGLQAGSPWLANASPTKNQLGAGRFALAIRLRFHHHAPQQLATVLEFYQQAADQLRGDDLSRAEEEALGEGLC